MTTPQLVLERFSALTGTPLRIPSSDQCAQAIAFCEHFTLEELELVVKWTLKEMKKDRPTLNKFSCQWRVLFGSYGGGQEFQVFQERLGLAMKERDARKPRAENLIPITRIMDESGSTITMLDCKPLPDVPEVANIAAGELARLKARIAL